MTAADLNNALAAATCAGCNITVMGTHHDFVMLPNGHLIVIAATQQVISGTTVTGDVLIDLDQNHNPVWLWNEFDHLDINRRPYVFPDWTHTNAVLYSADDGNLIISIRHQNWLVKMDYANGTGAGDILWNLGYQGDFTLDWRNGSDGLVLRAAWTFVHEHEHDGTILDGTFRQWRRPGVSLWRDVWHDGSSHRVYSTVPLLNIDETAKTATLTFHPTAPTYSFFGGNNAVLKNGNVEFCESAEPSEWRGTFTRSHRIATRKRLAYGDHRAYPIGARGFRACIPGCNGK